MRSRGDSVILRAAVKGPTPSLGQPDHYGLVSAKPGPQWMFRKPAAGQRPVCGATYAISRRLEYSPQTWIEGEIQQMDRSYPITELWRVVAGLAPGRRDVRQITLFDSVGFAIEDFSALQYVCERVAETGFCEALDMIADPDDPRDLFGMLERAR